MGGTTLDSLHLLTHAVENGRIESSKVCSRLTFSDQSVFVVQISLIVFIACGTTNPCNYCVNFTGFTDIPPKLNQLQTSLPALHSTHCVFAVVHATVWRESSGLE